MANNRTLKAVQSKLHDMGAPGSDAMVRATAIIWDRIEEAFDVLRRLPDPERSALKNAERGQPWPGMLHEAFEHAAHEGIKVRLPPPSAAQITRMHEALAWMLDLARSDQSQCKVVYLICAKRYGTMRTARTLGLDKKTVGSRLHAGLSMIANVFTRKKAA